jgi:hypothetical protein
MLMVNDPVLSRWEGMGMGSRRFLTLPRIGDHVELTVNGQAHFHRVVAVVHAEPPLESDSAGRNAGWDVYAVDEGPSVEVLGRIRSASTGGPNVR